MTDAPDAPRLAETFDEVEDALLSRWPETKLEPSLDRIEAFTELLGEPQHSFRSIHLTGTNGKTSTSRMIETLLRALDLRTGRFTSPHLERMSERISIDGEPLDDEAFVRAFNEIAPYTHRATNIFLFASLCQSEVQRVFTPGLSPCGCFPNYLSNIIVTCDSGGRAVQ